MSNAPGIARVSVSAADPALGAPLASAMQAIQPAPAVDVAFNASGGAIVAAGPFNTALLRIQVPSNSILKYETSETGVLAFGGNGTTLEGPAVEYISWASGSYLLVRSADANSGTVNLTPGL